MGWMIELETGTAYWIGEMDKCVASAVENERCVIEQT